MNSIAQAFAGPQALIAFLTAGDPSLEKTGDYILAIQKAGADLIEIGIPFSDPIAEEKVIQESNIRALQAGVTTDKVFAMLEDLQREVTVPLVFHTYLNPVYHYGYEPFLSRCRSCGVSGLIIPDMPFEEQGDLKDLAASYGVDLITLIAPTSQERVAGIAKAARGFIYLVSPMGVTDVQRNIITDVSAMIQEIKRYTEVPVAMTLSSSALEQTKDLSKSVDGVLVGSAIVRIIAEKGADAKEALEVCVRDLKIMLADMEWDT